MLSAIEQTNTEEESPMEEEDIIEEQDEIEMPTGLMSRRV